MKNKINTCLICFLLVLNIQNLNAQYVVDYNGLLKVNGNRIVNQHDEEVSFAGNSFFWSNDGWGGEKYYREEVVSFLKEDWYTTIVRASMGVEDPGGYLDNKEGNLNKVKTIVDAAIAEDMYVLIDWHSHHAEDHLEEAKTFFAEMATLYGHYDHVLYEIYNEPLDVSWSNDIKPYAEEVIATIRAIDPDNMIIVGTPEWSQRVDLPAADPITSSENIAYTLHFYSIHHHQWLRDRASDALESGIALFATEWGVLGDTFDDPETDEWMQWCLDNKISHCNWAVNDKEEAWSILKPGTGPLGGWTQDRLTIAGKMVKTFVKTWPSTIERPLSTGDITSEMFSFYPNPAKDELYLEFKEPTNAARYQIFTISGELLKEDVMRSIDDKIHVDISALDSGIYVLNIATEEFLTTTKFIKQ